MFIVKVQIKFRLWSDRVAATYFCIGWSNVFSDTHTDMNVYK